MPNLIDITNQRFGRLIAVRIIGKRGYKRLWECRCDCGQTTLVTENNLSGTKSCGCLYKETRTTAGTANRKHGQSGVRTKAYETWVAMRKRCRNPKHKAFRRYGGRGIAVCDRWLNSFENFFADMGEPQLGYTIERKNNDGPYSPENCVWATQEQQCNNKSTNRFLTYQGQTLTVTQWANKLGVSNAVIYYRLKHHWTIERALSTPTLKL